MALGPAARRGPGAGSSYTPGANLTERQIAVWLGEASPLGEERPRAEYDEDVFATSGRDVVSEAEAAALRAIEQLSPWGREHQQKAAS
jgi:hypothetical protein